MLPLRPQCQGVPLPGTGGWWPPPLAVRSALGEHPAGAGWKKADRFCKNQREKIIAEARG